MLGYSSIFNHLCPRLLLNLPFLGLHSEGRAWVLVSDTLGKHDAPRRTPSPVLFPATDYTPHYFDIGLEEVGFADSIDYWGHYPVLDLEYNTQAPIEVGLRAWSPFMPGDAVTSMMPAATFDFIVRNPGSERRSGALVFSWPGFETGMNARGVVRREALEDDLNGVMVDSGQAGDAWEMAYVLAAVNERDACTGGPLGADGTAWAQIGDRLPVAEEGETGSSLRLTFDLDAGEAKTSRVLLAWHAPHWRAGGAPSHDETNLFTHMYAKHYPDPLSTAKRLAGEADALSRRVIAWQEEIYNDADTPGWLADSLINILHLFPETSIWAQAKTPIGEWCRAEDGLHAMNECPRGCPQLECLPCSFYGNVPVVYFFPEAALSTLRAYEAYQFEDGRPPWIFGGVTARKQENKAPYDVAAPDVGYQTVLNGACYIVMADRYWQVSGEDEVLAEFWDSLKRANDFSMNLRPEYGPSQVVSMPTPGTDEGSLGDTEWFEAPALGWKGYVTHAGGVRMAQVAIMRRMAEAMGDRPYVEKCEAWLEAGATALEEHLWAEDYYLNYNEPETGEKSDLVFGYQLDGQWIADWHGVPGVFPEDRVVRTLETIRKFNCALSESGATNYANPDGTPAEVGGYGTYSYFPPELFMLASTFMYEGRKEFGLELTRQCMRNIVKWGYVWDFPNTMRGDKDTGQRTFGADYYQNLMLWAVPSAISGEDLTGPSKPGGLVARVIAAAQGAPSETIGS